MRRLVIGVLVAGVAAGACNRNPDTVSGTPAGTGQPDRGDATTGTGERAREPTPLEAAVAGRVREVTIPAGTELPIVLDTSVGVGHQPRRSSRYARTSRGPSWSTDRPCWPKAARSAASSPTRRRSAKVKGRAHVAVRFDSLTPRGGGRALPDRDGRHRPDGARDEEGRRAQDRRTGGGRRDHRRHRRRRERRGHRRGGRRRRGNGGRSLDARQGDSTAGGQRPARAPHRAAHDRIRG